MMSWHDILKREVAASTVTAVAAKIGYARTSVSLALHGRYPGKPPHNTDKIAARILEVFAPKTECPTNRKSSVEHDGDDNAQSPMPTHDPKKLRQWITRRMNSDKQGKTS